MVHGKALQGVGVGDRHGELLEGLAVEHLSEVGREIHLAQGLLDAQLPDGRSADEDEILRRANRHPPSKAPLSTAALLISWQEGAVVGQSTLVNGAGTFRRFSPSSCQNDSFSR